MLDEKWRRLANEARIKSDEAKLTRQLAKLLAELRDYHAKESHGRPHRGIAYHEAMVRRIDCALTQRIHRGEP